MAVAQLLRRLVQKVADELPEGVARGLRLHKVKRTRAVRGPGRKRVAHARLARRGYCAIRELDLDVAHVAERVHRADRPVNESRAVRGGPRRRRTANAPPRGSIATVESPGKLRLAAANDSGRLERVCGWPAAAAVLVLATARRVHLIARLASVRADGAVDIGRDVAQVGGRERGHEAALAGRDVVAVDPVLEDVRGVALVVAGQQRICVGDARTMHRKPVDQAHGRAVCLLDDELRHVQVRVAGVERALPRRVVAIRGRRPVDAGVASRHLAARHAQ
mmetsp:Transcript_5178/g.16650  ORF Transcript_5178/g.16650 Transcript_5178/m.16650 type:complete len:278 (+) Transcript_5178:1058-1891(+)